MAYVITQRCCNDASCVAECPVDCIRPRPGDPQFASAEMLYIDPDTCIDCGACYEACPVDAIYAEEDLPAHLAGFRDVNAGFFARHPLEPDMAAPPPVRRLAKDLGTLRVAIVGTGPAACYAAEQLLVAGTVEVEMFDRLPTPWGLARYGVAPDHAQTRGVTDMFASAFKRDALQMYLNTEIGTHIGHAELRESVHAVIYAVGTPADRRLDIPGEVLAGSISATEFVAWYNGNPGYADRVFDLSGERAVIVGNGNVALDIARVLTMDPDELARTDIADHALAALRESAIREVVILGRRGLLQAAYTAPEFRALARLDGVDIVVDPGDLVFDEAAQAYRTGAEAPYELGLKLAAAEEFAGRPPRAGNKRIVFRYCVSLTEIVGTDRVNSLRYVRNELTGPVDAPTARPTGETGELDTSLVLRAVGYRGEPVGDLPFDDERGVLPTIDGRVVDAAGAPVPGVYAAGWIKRGPRGVIGSNRADAEETVAAILDDFRAGVLPTPVRDRAALSDLVRDRQPQVVDRTAWQAVDRAERAAGAAAGRPRVKLATVAELLATARRG
ncbi:4Fe-4S binding protein [Nocardia testacea]|uniref:4Fe-4S binding protein n=1 Tax=Nocardia testacea TaxID=248551 RepID=UPI00031E37A2|nr:4Fe-4S binding protein [Nocardia testacea]